ASPYEVLAAFGERVGETYASEDVLPRIARVIAEGTAAARANVWLRLGDTLTLAASFPATGAEAAAPLARGGPPGGGGGPRAPRPPPGRTPGSERRAEPADRAARAGGSRPPGPPRGAGRARPRERATDRRPGGPDRTDRDAGGRPAGVPAADRGGAG